VATKEMEKRAMRVLLDLKAPQVLLDLKVPRGLSRLLNFA
jgi:hypothetical protein